MPTPPPRGASHDPGHERASRGIPRDGFFSVREQLTDEQGHFITVRQSVDEEVVPVVGPYWERAEICWPLIRRLPELGAVGEDIKGYGCAGRSPMACGLVTMELHRGDGNLGVALGVHAGLAAQSVAMLGSEEQKERWLPGPGDNVPATRG